MAYELDTRFPALQTCFHTESDADYVYYTSAKVMKFCKPNVMLS